MLNWGPHLTKKSRLPLPGRKDRTQSSVLGCTSQMSYVESKADVRNGLAEPRAGFWHCCLPRAGVEEELCTAESAPLPVWCFFTVTSSWKHSDRLTTQKMCFLFSLLDRFLLRSTIKSFILIHCLIYNGFCPSYTEMPIFWVKYNCARVHTLSPCNPWPLHFRNVTRWGVYRRLNIGLSVLVFPWKIFFLQHMEIKHTEQY